MLLTITNTHPPAADLGYLLHKNPARLHMFELSFGKVYVFYPEASDERPELAEAALPLEAHLAALPCRSGEAFLRRLFEPLGYAVAVQPHPLDPTFPEWGQSPYYTVELRGSVRLRDLLTHLYVLIP